MDEAEGNKRIAFWEVKKAAYILQGKKSGIARADATIKRIKAAMNFLPKQGLKKGGSIVESEHKRDIKSNDGGKGEGKGGLM